MRRRWLLFMAALVPLMAAWSLTNPMFAAPDEPSHIARAQGFSNFDFSSPYRTDGLPIAAQECFRFRPWVTADCADYSWGQPAEVDTKTRDYPPLFHAIASVPAFVTSGLDGAYAMRLWMVVVCSSLLAWAGALIVRPGRGRWSVVAVALSLTPMSIFVSSTVNPSGITIAFAILAVAGAVARWCHHDRSRAARLASWVGLPGLLLVRRDGVLWAAIVIAALAPLVLADPVARARLAVLDPRRWNPRTRLLVLAALAFVVVAASLWVVPVLHRFFTTGEVEGNGSHWQGIEVMRIYFDQMMGTFGWIDTYIGQEAYTLAAGVSILILLIGLVGTDRRFVVSESIALGALFVTPVVFGMFLYPYFQGRYLLPIWVVLMVSASLSVDSSQITPVIGRRLAGAVLVLWGGVHVWSIVQNLRRYAVGFRGTWWFASDYRWHPPSMSNLTAVIGIAVACSITLVAMRRLLAIADRG